MSIIAFSSTIGPVPIACVLSEKHESRIEISEIPIETGAKITDHAYLMPKRVTLDVADGNAAATFNALVQFQESRAPFILVTGLSVYRNMLIRSLDADRDASFSRVLRCKAELHEVIIVDTAYAAAENGNGSRKGSNPGGAKTPTKATAGDAATADRASGPVQRGDAPAAATTPQDQSILKSILQ